MKKSVLEVDSVQKFFGSKLVLSDIYQRCETGEIIGLMGRNGTGKSTLLKIIFGTVKADNKFVRINGRVRNTTAELLGEVSYLSQDNFIPKYFSVSKAISLAIPIERENDFLADPAIEKINDLILNSSKSKGIIITDHNYENVLKISSRIVLLQDGCAIHLKNKSDLTDSLYLTKEA